MTVVGKRWRQWFAIDQFRQCVDSIVNAAIEITFAELWLDVLPDDTCGGGIRNRTFESVADFNAHVMVVLGNNQNRAVIGAHAPEFPFLADADAILRDILGIGRRNNQYAELRSLALLKR